MGLGNCLPQVGTNNNLWWRCEDFDPEKRHIDSNLGGGFEYFWCSPLLGEDEPNLTIICFHYFSDGWFNHQLEKADISQEAGIGMNQTHGTHGRRNMSGKKIKFGTVNSGCWNLQEKNNIQMESKTFSDFITFILNFPNLSHILHID